MHGSELRCLNCGDAYTMNLPAPFDIVTATMKAFDKSHSKCKPSDAGRARFAYTTPEQWLSSWDTGESSKTIWHFMLGRTYRSQLPRDPSDFGRCYRLLQAFPSWRGRLPEMAEQLRSWAPIIAAWPTLEKLYEDEMKSGECPKLYAALQVFE